jgi:hypothetical protein
LEFVRELNKFSDSVYNFNTTARNRWRGELAADPTTDLQGGDIFFNTTTHLVKIYAHGGWVTIS